MLELYKKPTDLKRKKLSLLTVKPLYLHLAIDLIKRSAAGASAKLQFCRLAFGAAGSAGAGLGASEQCVRDGCDV